jgi:hypothetical protein
MFDQLTQKLQKVFKNLRGEGGSRPSTSKRR